MEVFADTPEEAEEAAIEKVERGEAEVYGQIVVCAEVLYPLRVQPGPVAPRPHLADLSKLTKEKPPTLIVVRISGLTNL